MLKLQTKVSVVKMSKYSTYQHSTQTTIKSIAFKQNIEYQQISEKSGSILVKERIG
jgi:hypothetical protein